MRVGALFCALLVGCTEAIVVAPPELGGAGSLVMVVRDGTRFAVEAFAVDGSEIALKAEIHSLESYELHALVYDAPLSDLGLEPGPVEIVADPPSRTLPPSTRELTLIRDADGLPSGWHQDSARAAEVASILVRAPSSPCAEFTVEPLPPTGAAEQWGFAFPRAGGELLIGARQGQLLTVAADGTVQNLPRNQRFEPRAGAMDAAGGMWVGDQFGEVWRGAPGSLPDAWVRLEPGSPLSSIDFVDVAPDASQVVALAFNGGVASWTEDGGWQFLHRLERPAESSGTGGIVWLAKDDLLVVNASALSVTRIRGGVVTEEPVGSRAAFTALKRVEGVGIVAGSGLGELFVRRAERWESMGDSNSGFWVLGMAPYEGGFVWGSPYGNMGQYVGEQFCPVFNPVTFFVRFVFRFDRDLLVLGEAFMPATPLGALLRRR